MSSALVPMYVSEIAPVNLRGGVGIVNQLAVTIGMLLSQVRYLELTFDRLRGVYLKGCSLLMFSAGRAGMRDRESFSCNSIL